MKKIKYNHIDKNFGKLVNDKVEKLAILSYYPYGNEVQFASFGGYNLKKLYKEEKNVLKTEQQLVISIYQEISRAMNYLMVNGNYHWFDEQRIQAFAIHKLINNGIIGYNKKLKDGKSSDEVEKLIQYHSNRYDLVSGRGKYADKYTKIREKHLTPKYNEMVKKLLDNNREKYGIYEVRILPLTQYANCNNVPKILYTKQELCAIDLMVSCYFENLC
jgi:hypothetical protein